MTSVPFIADAIFLHRIIDDFEGVKSQRQRSESFSREVHFMKWLSVAFLVSVVFIVIRVGFELTTPVL